MRGNGVLFWGILFLLVLMCIIPGASWRYGLKRAYRRTVNALKWQPFLPYISGERESKKKHITLEKECGTQAHRESYGKIFIRNRTQTQ